MTVPEWISAIVALADTAIASGKSLLALPGSQLAERDRELLSSAAGDGQFVVLHSRSEGRYVETAKRRFTDDDPAITAKYLDAFLRLCELGLLIHQNGCTFRLTGQGFDIARKLRDEKPLE